MTAIIWIIGWLFTCGVEIDPADKSAKWMIPLSVLAWPLLLGCAVRCHLSNSQMSYKGDGKG